MSTCRRGLRAERGPGGPTGTHAASTSPLPSARPPTRPSATVMLAPVRASVLLCLPIATTQQTPEPEPDPGPRATKHWFCAGQRCVRAEAGSPRPWYGTPGCEEQCHTGGTPLLFLLPSPALPAALTIDGWGCGSEIRVQPDQRHVRAQPARCLRERAMRRRLQPARLEMEMRSQRWPPAVRSPLSATFCESRAESITAEVNCGCAQVRAVRRLWKLVRQQLRPPLRGAPAPAPAPPLQVPQRHVQT